MLIVRSQDIALWVSTWASRKYHFNRSPMSQNLCFLSFFCILCASVSPWNFIWEFSLASSNRSQRVMLCSSVRVYYACATRCDIESNIFSTIFITNKVPRWIESFISEIGGALGLFLGFSFLMVWDFLKVILISERTKRCYSTIDEC